MFWKKISYKFFKWRYFSDKYSFCFGAFYKSKLIANVGMFSMMINNDVNNKSFSRHSSMVDKQYQGIGIYSKLLKNLKKIISTKVSYIVMWPNKNNYSNFDLNKKDIKKNKFYLCKTFSKKKSSAEFNTCPIKHLKKYKKYIKTNDHFFLKDYKYFKKRYIDYKNKEYLINKFELKNLKSFFIIKFEKNISGNNYTILDHFGSSILVTKHLDHLIKNKNNLIFLSKKKPVSNNQKIINYLNFNIGYIKKLMTKKEKIYQIKKFF